MARTAKEIIQEAMEMPPEERAKLAERLLSSLDAPKDEDVEVAWQQEAARRLEQIRTGEARTVSWESVRDRLRGKGSASG
jgi:putative addiction module component (TIGR02574 family)